jgi:23S rRNA (adenine2503-C2)-methyltransferase
MMIINLYHEQFNPWPNSGFECSSLERIVEFSSILNGKGLRTTIRWPKGREIYAACGQLNSINAIQEISEENDCND